jgi:hypothetical protein
MSFWVGLVVIVLILEALRIGLSSYLLIHILRGIQPGGQPLSPDDPQAQVDPRHEVGWSRERDRLASEAMIALRRAMDGLTVRGGEADVAPAIAALDAYVLHHLDAERG